MDRDSPESPKRCQPTLTVCPTCQNDLTKCVGHMRMESPPTPLTPPWQDPEQEDFWRSRPEPQRISVKLSQHATEAIWHLYNISREGFIPISFEGDVLEQPLTYEDALEYCLWHRAFVYNLARRRAWRLAWGVPLREQRERRNARFEPVEVLGYKGISDQWTDRPRTKLFANDF